MRTARESVLSLVEIGKQLEAIHRCFRAINAISAVDDAGALNALTEARRCARTLVRELDRFELEEYK
jgi:hypothetical protein